MSEPRDKAETYLTRQIMVGSLSIQIWLAAEKNETLKICRDSGMSDSELQMMIGIMVAKTFTAHASEIDKHLKAGKNPQIMMDKLRYWFAPEGKRISDYVTEWNKTREQYQSEHGEEA